MTERLFSEEELREMEKRSVDRVTEAIDAGDLDGAKRIAQRMYNEFLAMHDLYRDWTAATLSAVGRRFGDEALEAIMEEGVGAWWLPIRGRMPEGREKLRQRVKMFVAGLRGHLQPMSIREDDEKVVVQMHPCGSGGRLVLEDRYGPDGFLEVEGPQRMTYGRERFPVYCAHEAAMESVDIDAHGSPFVVVEPAERLGEQPCSFVIYKDPSKVPARYYERVGRRKPGAG